MLLQLFWSSAHDAGVLFVFATVCSKLDAQELPSPASRRPVGRGV